MFTLQISDRDTFVKKAKKLDIPVRIVSNVIAVPVQDGPTLMMRTALAINYSLEFTDPKTGETRWTFREVVPTDPDGAVLLTNSLWSDLRREGAKEQVLHRSGSV